MGIALVTDSTACLPPYRLAQAAVEVVPVQVVLGDQVYDEGASINSVGVIAALRSNVEVTTASPGPERFAEVYSRLAAAGADGIVSMHLSSELSGTYSAAVLAAREAPVPVRVVDTRTVGLALGFAVLHASELLRHGANAESTAAAAAASGRAARVWLSVDNLDALRRGGRIGTAQAAVGSVLAIKPILEVANGRLQPLEKVRTAGRAAARLVELAAQAVMEMDVACQIGVQHAGAPDRAAALARDLGRAVPGVPVVTTDLGAVLTAHVGPGAIAVIVSPL